MGNFNLTFATHEMKNTMVTAQEKRIGIVVRDLVRDANLKDVWEGRKGFTWRRANTDCS